MRLKHPPLLCFYFFIQLTLAYQRNDYFKNAQRTNTKKYYPANRNTSIDSNNKDNIKIKPSTSKFPRFDQLKDRIDNLYTSENSDRNNLFGTKSRSSDSPKYFNSDNRWGTIPRLRHHGYSNRGRISTTTTPSPNEDSILFENYDEAGGNRGGTIIRLRHHGYSNKGRTSKSRTTTTTSSPEDNILFENYGDLDEEDDEQTEDNYPDIFIDTSDYDEMKDNVQAEEPTSTETSTKVPTYASFSDYKWKNFGTREGVEKSRNNYLKLQENLNRKSPEENREAAAVQHYFRVKSSSECKNPSPKVIPVHVEHPNPSVTYVPHCTVLHRCAEDTGCCKYDTTCQFKERVEVSLYFYVKEIGGDTSKVEKLTFYNHTECECREKEPSTATERQKRVADNRLKNIYLPTTNKVPENLLMKCKCPKEFLPKIKSGTKCSCDCDNSNEDCIRMKKGQEYSSLVDRLCIQKRECGTVTCQYGPYNKEKGRCPKFEES